MPERSGPPATVTVDSYPLCAGVRKRKGQSWQRRRDEAGSGRSEWGNNRQGGACFHRQYFPMVAEARASISISSADGSGLVRCGFPVDEDGQVGCGSRLRRRDETGDRHPPLVHWARQAHASMHRHRHTGTLAHWHRHGRAQATARALPMQGPASDQRLCSDHRARASVSVSTPPETERSRAHVCGLLVSLAANCCQ